MTIIFVLGRILFGSFFLQNGYSHFKNVDSLATYAAAKGVHNARKAVLASGALLVVGGVSIILGLWPGIGILALLLFMIPTTYKMHAYWKVTDPVQKISERIQFHKNVAIVGALLMLTFAIRLWPISL